MYADQLEHKVDVRGWPVIALEEPGVTAASDEIGHQIRIVYRGAHGKKAELIIGNDSSEPQVEVYWDHSGTGHYLPNFRPLESKFAA